MDTHFVMAPTGLLLPYICVSLGLPISFSELKKPLVRVGDLRQTRKKKFLKLLKCLSVFFLKFFT